MIFQYNYYNNTIKSVLKMCIFTILNNIFVDIKNHVLYNAYKRILKTAGLKFF